MFSCAVFENNVYISGGTDTYDDSVDMYVVDKDVWTRLTATLNDGSSYYRQIINLNGALYLFAKVTEVYKDGIWSLVNDSTISGVLPMIQLYLKMISSTWRLYLVRTTFLDKCSLNI